MALAGGDEPSPGCAAGPARRRMRTGTVVTTDNRNWELRFDDLFGQLNHSRAIAIDMESATVAANGYRFRVPYGTLLCVSDKPLHGELKLRGMANAFYEERISQHLRIGIETMRLLREQGVDRSIRASCAASTSRRSGEHDARSASALLLMHDQRWRIAARAAIEPRCRCRPQFERRRSGRITDRIAIALPRTRSRSGWWPGHRQDDHQSADLDLRCTG